MPCWRMPWQNNIGPIGLDLGADTPRAMQVRLGVDEPRIRTTARIEPAADLVERAQRRRVWLQPPAAAGHCHAYQVLRVARVQRQRRVLRAPHQAQRPADSGRGGRRLGLPLGRLAGPRRS